MSVYVEERSAKTFNGLRTGGSLIRDQIALSTPSVMQPFLTWLTACPTDGEMHKECRSTDCVKYSIIRIILGLIAYVSSCNFTGYIACTFYVVSVLIMTSSFGLLQVGVFHYCSHGTVFKSKNINMMVGRVVSVICLLPSFDFYQKKHMRHHSHEVLLAEEDEFSEFIIKQCRLKPGTSKNILWFRTLSSLFSPVFHLRFMTTRIFLATEYASTLIGKAAITSWILSIIFLITTGYFYDFIKLFLVPLSVPFQITVVLRTLCEHHAPDNDLNIVRDRSLPDHATRPVFAGCLPPSSYLEGSEKLIAWSLWWLKMMTFHFLFRVIVLVGDAARHDLHHARPGNRDWANYMRDRYTNRRPAEYFCSNESWGCFSTIDKCLSSISSSNPQLETRLL